MLEIIMPDLKTEGERNVKDLVFSLLVEGTSKTLTQLHREIKKIYGVAVSFQAVMKAVNSLVAKNVLFREGMAYIIDKTWIFESRNFIDKLYRTHFNVQEPIKKIELGKEIIVYTVNNLLELDRLWNDLLVNWAKEEKVDRRNVWRGRHCWWLIPRLQEEDSLHDLFSRQKIETYNLICSNTLLDKVAFNYYKKKGENSIMSKKIKLDKDSHLSVFGEFLLKFEIPEIISERLERIYNKIKRVEDIDLKQVLDIFKENQTIEVTVIRDKMLSGKIKEEIISSF